MDIGQVAANEGSSANHKLFQQPNSATDDSYLQRKQLLLHCPTRLPHATARWQHTRSAATACPSNQAVTQRKQRRCGNSCQGGAIGSIAALHDILQQGCLLRRAVVAERSCKDHLQRLPRYAGGLCSCLWVCVGKRNACSGKEGVVNSHEQRTKVLQQEGGIRGRGLTFVGMEVRQDAHCRGQPSSNNPSPADDSAAWKSAMP